MTTAKLVIKHYTMQLWCEKCKRFTLHIILKNTGVYVCPYGHTTNVPRVTA